MKIVVAVGGAFDQMQIGHLQHIREAKKLGDYLIVILNPDADIMRKRGMVASPMGERYEILKEFRSVDEVVIGIDDDGTVAKTLLMIKPDIFAKGGDRSESSMPKNELEICKKIGCKIIYGVGEQLGSSTNRIRKIREWAGEIKHNPSGDFK